MMNSSWISGSSRILSSRILVASLGDLIAIGARNGKPGPLSARGRCWPKVRRVPAKARYYKQPCGSL